MNGTDRVRRRWTTGIRSSLERHRCPAPGLAASYWVFSAGATVPKGEGTSYEMSSFERFGTWESNHEDA